MSQTTIESLQLNTLSQDKDFIMNQKLENHNKHQTTTIAGLNFHVGLLYIMQYRSILLCWPDSFISLQLVTEFSCQSFYQHLFCIVFLHLVVVSLFFRGPHKVEEACEMYCRAANMFKMAKNWSGAFNVRYVHISAALVKV